MSKAKKADKKLKIKKKVWYEIVAPKIFNNTVLGETIVTDLGSCIGKTLSVNLMAITGNPRNQSININFKITKVEGSKAIADIMGYEISNSSVKRFARRGKEKVDVSFCCNTADNIKLRIKPVMTTKEKTKDSVLTALRKKTIEFITEACSKMNYEDIMCDILSYKLQKALKDELKRIYPLGVCDIRYCGIEKRKKVVVESVVVKTEEEEKEEEAEEEQPTEVNEKGKDNAETSN